VKHDLCLAVLGTPIGQGGWGYIKVPTSHLRLYHKDTQALHLAKGAGRQLTLTSRHQPLYPHAIRNPLQPTSVRDP
jgi:hypothetical protein